MMERKDVADGDEFCRLTVVGDQYKVGKHWMCNVKCVCGKSKRARVWQLVNGRMVSCGCLKAERHTAFLRAAKIGDRNGN